MVTSGNYKISPYVEEQAINLINKGINIDYYFIIGHNSIGYLKNLPALKKKIKAFSPDLIHAHYSLSGLLAYLSGFSPILVTYHGSDVNDSKHIKFSRIISLLSKHNIFVEESLLQKLKPKRSSSVIPCGVNMDEFYPIEKEVARKHLHIADNKRIILFSSSFDRKVKNYHLAKSAIDLLDSNYELVELKHFTRKDVMLFINAADACIMTSFNEGSPQFIKEVMACNSPAVSTDVGDVKKLFGNIPGYYISEPECKSFSKKILQAVKFRDQIKHTMGRERILSLGLSNDNITAQILEVYNMVLGSRTPENIMFNYDHIGSL